MMISSLDLADKNELAFLAELVADLRAAAPAWEPLLVGAMARDLLLYYAHKIPVSRATEDVDFGFAVAKWEDFAALRAVLAKEADPDGPLRLVGEAGGRDAENMRLLLAAFLRGFNGEEEP